MTFYIFLFLGIMAVIQAFFDPYLPQPTLSPPKTYIYNPVSQPRNKCDLFNKYDLDIEDTTIVINALHYYKKVDKKGNFKQYTPERINKLRDKIIDQQMKNIDQNIKNKKETNAIFPPMFLLFL